MFASGCEGLDIIDHDALVEVPEGNQQSAIERCGELPAGFEGIPTLRTAWAMHAVPVKDRDATFRVATESMVLRFSDEGLSCDDALDHELLTCPDAWATDIVLRQAEPAPGTYLLPHYGQGYSLATVWREGRDCHGEVVDGTFDSGEIEILSVTDECVVGRLIDTSEALGDAGVDVEGAFVALRCDTVQVQ